MNAYNTAVAFADAAEIEAPAEIAAELPPMVRYAGDAVIDRDALAYAIALARLVVSKRNSIPILSNVKLIAAGASSLAFIATDLDMEIRVEIPAALDDGFGVTLPAHLLSDMAKRAPASDMVAFRSQGETSHKHKSGETMFGSVGRTMLDFEGVKYHLDALPVADFPALASPEFSHAFTMGGGAFIDLLQAVESAMSKEETRYYLNGIYLHSVASVPSFGPDGMTGGAGFRMRAVTTDGHRLYRQEIDAPAGTAGMPGVILPRALVDLLGKIMRGKACPAEVTVGVSDTRFRVQFGAVTITSKLVDGTFPDYQRVIPTGNDLVAKFDSADMQKAIGAVTIISSERGKAFKLVLGDGKATLLVNNPDSGAAEMSIACEVDREIEIGFNAGYMTTLLSDMGEGEIEGKFGDSGSPTLFTSPARDGFLAVLMPMRV